MHQDSNEQLTKDAALITDDYKLILIITFQYNAGFHYDGG